MTERRARPRRFARVRALTAAAGLALACEPGIPVDPAPAPVTSLVVTPDTVIVDLGQTVPFHAHGRTNSGDSVPVDVDWSASHGTISPDGLLTVDSSTSDVTVTAALPGTGLSATAHARKRYVVSVIIAPDGVVLVPGAEQQFTATGVRNVGDSVPVQVSFVATGGTISPSGRYVAGDEPGTYRVVGTHDRSRAADTAAVTVIAPPVASVEVAPGAATIEEDETVQLTATARDADGNVLIGRPITWSSSDDAVATVSPSGLVTGVVAGNATITATSEGESGTAAITVSAPPTPAVFVGAGDIADCGTSTDEATASLLDGIAGTVFTTGDNAYPDGTASNFTNCYEPTWGRHEARTRPTPGNHDYHTSGASAYFAYFGANAGDPGTGYYSFELGAWHIIALNSNVSMSAGSAQEQWLRAELAASGKTCTLAYWHHPRFSSGNHGNDPSSAPLWDALYDAGAELVLAGHDHNYERFAPQTPSGAADPATGIRQFVVGTGGTSLRGMNAPVANSEVRNSDTHGVLELTLGDGTYTWEFIPVAGRTFTDQGSGVCH